ncbi:hypothetical protein DSS3P8_041 [Roseobacter phage DSS3P8]|nr:hypothetical protein DSS3P8_041 [Roseobacter phage DSS3P8]
MAGVVVNGSRFISGLESYEERFHKMFRNKVRRLVTEGMDRLLRKTPVNTGQAVSSYVASGGSPKSSPPGPRGKPVQATNHLPLGAEKLRAQSEAPSRATVAGIDFADPYKTFWITNNAPHIGGLEAGSLPNEPYTPRSPAGMFGVTVQELVALLSSGSI